MSNVVVENLEEQKMIRPTIGRILHYVVPEGENDALNGNGTYAAIITEVWSDSLVNLCVFDQGGTPRPRTSVELFQGNVSIPPTDRPYCQWMPYQVAQNEKA